MIKLIKGVEYNIKNNIAEVTNIDSSLTEVIIVDDIDGIPVTQFSSKYSVLGLKKNSSIKKIVIGNKIQSLPDVCFSYLPVLKEIHFGKNLERIPSGCCLSCESLERVTFSQGKNSFLNHIYQQAFYNCKSLKEIILPENIRSIGLESFYRCYSLEKLVLPKSLQTIPFGIIASTPSLKYIEIPENVSTINSLFMHDSGLQTIHINSSFAHFNFTKLSGYLDVLSEKDYLVSLNLDVSKHGADVFLNYSSNRQFLKERPNVKLVENGISFRPFSFDEE